MRYICKEYDGSKSVSSVFQNDEQTFLTWSSSSNDDCIIIKADYMKDLNVERFCEVLSTALIKEGIKLTDLKDFFEIEDRAASYNKLYKIAYVDKRQHALAGGINISERGCRYTVLACGFETDSAGKELCYIVKPNPKTIYVPYTDIQFELKMDILAVENESSSKGALAGLMGMFKRKQEEEDASFYKIEFDKDYSSQCSNNDLSYRIGSFEIPFTKKLLKNKLFYIKTEQKPIIINKNEGLKLIINGKEYM